MMAGQPPKPLSHFLAQSVGVLEQIGISRQKKRFLSLLREKIRPETHPSSLSHTREHHFVALPRPRAPFPTHLFAASSQTNGIGSFRPRSHCRGSMHQGRGEAPLRPRCKVASRSVPAGRTGGCRRSRSSGPRWGCRCAPWHRRPPRCRRRAWPSPAPPPGPADPPRSRWGPR